MKNPISPRNELTRREIGKGIAAGLAVGSLSLAPRAAPAAGARDPERRGGLPSAATLGTLTLVNDGNRATTPGTPTRTFGWPFARGQIPAGQAPVFTMGGVIQPFSANPANARRYWPDGSLMYCSFMLRPTFSVAPHGTQKVAISPGGGWPPAATRNVAEVYAQDLAIICPPLGLSWVEPNATYAAWLNSTNAGNIIQTRHWLTGDAGECWGFTINMSRTAGGTPHGQLVCDIFLIALTDGSGRLGGFRFWADLRQPYFTVDTPTKITRYFAPPDPTAPSTGLHWTVAGSKPLVPDNWPFPATGLPFTIVSNPPHKPSAFALQSTPRYGKFDRPSPTYFGGGASFDVVPVRVTGDHLPSNIANNSILWLLTLGHDAGDASNTEFMFAYSAVGTGDVVVGPNATGSGTATPLPTVQPFGRFAIGGADGEYLFFQGSGSIAADTPLRSGVVDQKHWVASGMLPPWDTSLKGSVFGGPIQDNKWDYPYNPYSHGDLVRDLTAAGNGPYLAPIPNGGMIEFYNGSRTAYRAMLFCGLGEGNQLYDIVDANFPNAPANLSNQTYTGLGPPATYLTGGGRGGPPWNFGPHKPPNDVGGLLGCIGFDSPGGDHAPNYAGWAYLRTGRLELLDRVVNQVSIFLTNDSRNTGVVPGKAYYGCVTAFSTQYRDIGWMCRNLAFAALVYPNDPSGLNNAGGLSFAGSQTGKYLTDLLDANFQLTLDVMDPANRLYQPPAAQNYLWSRKVWVPTGQDSTGFLYTNDGPEWEFAYIFFAACWGAGIGIPACITFLKYAAARWEYIRTKLGGGFNIFHYYQTLGPGTAAPHVGRSLITSDQDWVISILNTWAGAGANNLISWIPLAAPSRTARAFSTLPGGTWNNGYAPHDGDYIAWGTATAYTNPQPPPGFAYNTTYVLADVIFAGGAYRFNLSTLGGVRMPTTTSGSSPSFSWRQNYNPLIGSAAYGDSYLSIFYGACCWGKAILGTAIFDNLINDILHRERYTPGLAGKFYWQTGGGTDCRYAEQQSFR